MKRFFGIGILFFAVAFLIYGKSLGNLFVRWDDSLLIYENPIVREISFETVTKAFTTFDPELYVPFTMMSYQIDHLLWGLNPFGFHLTNLVLHTFNALLVFCFVTLLLRSLQSSVFSLQKSCQLIAVFCGLLFLVHPLHTEAVAWASARKDVLSTFFFLVSMCGYLSWKENSQFSILNSQFRNGWYVISVITFALGLMSKVSIIMLPVILLLFEWIRGTRNEQRATYTSLLPYFLLSGVFGVIGLFGKRGAFSLASYSEKIIVAPKSTLFYLEKFFWPAKFSVLYPYTDASITSPEFFVPLIIVLFLTAVAVWFCVRAKASFYTSIISFGYFFFIISLLPTFLNIARGGDMDRYFASDRYAYVASIGLILIIATLLHCYIARQKKCSISLIAICIAVLVPLAWKAHAQSLLWGDTEVLLQNVLDQYGDVSHVAHNNMGNVYRLRGEYERAVGEYEKALEIRPHTKILANLGATYRRMHRYTDAQRVYEEALKINAENAEVQIGYGLLLTELGQLDAARDAYEKAIALRSDLEEAHVNLGALAMREGKIDEAIGYYHDALDVNPYFFQALYNLGVALQQQGKINESIAAYERAVELLPTFIAARINLGILYANTGRRDEAITEFQSILAIDPQNPSAKSALQQLGSSL